MRRAKFRNEYIEDDGTVSVGDYDVVPLIDRFVEEHPDFSYRGAKGIVALTGYNGILGYRTDISYQTPSGRPGSGQDAALDCISLFSSSSVVVVERDTVERCVNAD